MRIRRTVCAVVLAIGVLPLAPLPSAGAPPGFVTRNGTQLLVDGRPWSAIGVNFWDMEPYKALGNDLSGCYYQHPNLDSYFESSFRHIAGDLHSTVIRTFAFREWFTAGGQDYSSIDKLLYYAQKYNVRVIPVLGDQFSACGISGKGLDWYHCAGDCEPGYKKPSIYGRDYRSYVVETVARYKDNPTIAFWQLMNEPMYAVRNQERDPYALLSFTQDMVSAIRNEAGDTNHLINTGTGQGVYGDVAMTSQLLDCRDSPLAGCNDLAEGHDYSGAPLNGSPLPSSVGVSMVVSNSYDRDIVTYPKAAYIDDWVQFKTTAKHNGLPDLYWSVLMSVPESSRPWRLYIDDALATTAAGPGAYSFETDEQGFAAQSEQGTETTPLVARRTTDTARTGFASLAVDIPAGVRVVRIKPPVLPGPPQSVEFWLKLRFDAPAPDYGTSTASMLHQTAVSKDKPFFLGEAGIPGQVPGSGDIAPLLKTECIQKAPLIQRASMFDAMFARQMDADHRSAGIIAWDWKDPADPPTAPDGSSAPDKGIGCFTITPGDPANDVFAKWAAKVDVPVLPEPDPLPPPVMTMFVLKGPPPLVGAGSTFPVVVRVTNGGNPVRNFNVAMSGVCAGNGKTDAIGIAQFNCKVTQEQGPGSVVTDPDPLCSCSIPPVTQPVTVGRFIRTGALASVVERGDEAPVTISLAASDGGSLLGTTWALPECGRAGTVDVDASATTVETTCATSLLPVGGPLPLHVQATDASGIVSGSVFTLLLFDRIYVDPVTGDCAGLALDSGTVGALEVAGACIGGLYGAASKWFVFIVPPSNRSIGFHQVGDTLIVTAAQGGTSNRKVVGTFVYGSGAERTFTALITGRDGTPRTAKSG